MSFKINILICTIDEGIHNIHQLLEPFNDDVEYKISHQIRDEKYLFIPDNLKRKDVSISQIQGKGLSRNRNNTLKMATGDIAVIADDDVKYLPESFKIIANVFESDPDLDVACFKIKTNEGEPENKKYPDHSFVIKKHKHHYVSSIEIAFRIQSVVKNNIHFDERFGLGNDYLPDAEELVFIKDCIRSGQKVVYFPFYTVVHPFEYWHPASSQYTSVRNRIRGAYHARVLGWMAIPLALWEIISRFHLIIKHKRNPLLYIYERYKAIFYIFKTNQK